MPRRLLAAVAVLIAAPTVAFAANPAEVLGKAEMADRNVSYRGMKVVTVYLGADTERAVMKTVHLKPDRTRTEYYSPDALAGIILIRDGDEMWKFIPKEDAWEQSPCRCGPACANLCRDALDNYELRLIGTDRIAGRQAYVIQAVPRAGGSTAHRVWIDQEFYLVIGTQLEHYNGSIVNSSRYTTIEFNPDDISPSAFKVSGKVRQAPQPAPVKFEVAVPSYVPKGYRLVGRTSLTVNGRSCAHLQFSNGANTISLFQRTAGGGRPVGPVRGKTTQMKTWTQKGMVFTLIGDVPRAELDKMARSIK